MNKLKTTTGRESVAHYLALYGFCHWQAQEVIRERDRLIAALRQLGQLAPQGLREQIEATLAGY
jgi:hypothetical protein